jgi:HlyD family secretion protein
MYKNVIIASGVALAGLAGYLLAGNAADKPLPPAASRTTASPLGWVAAAPGRVEPKSGEVRISSPLLGRVVEVTTKVNDKVEEGELLIRLDDDEARARLAAAEAEAGARKRERTEQPISLGREETIKAEDGVYEAERAVTGARYELDYALLAKRNGTGDAQSLADARKRVSDARELFQKKRMAFAVAQAKPNLPTPNRFESALTAARANVTMADALLDRTQIRAPEAATVLQVNAKVGEMAAPGGEQPLIVTGDMSLVRVKAEVDDGDIAKLKVGQKAFVKSINYPGREFEGRVSALAPTLASPRISGRGPRRLTDVEVLEMTIDLDGKVPLLPGMRVDAFVRKD